MYRKNVKTMLALSACIALSLLPQSLKSQVITLPAAGPTAVITSAGGGPVVEQALDVSGVPAGDYFQFSLTAQFNPEGANPCWSSDIRFQLTSGANTLFPMSATAGDGFQADPSVVDVTWEGIMLYTGGDPISAGFRSSFHDAMGPYTCTMSNIRLEIRPLLGTGNITPTIPGPFNIVSGIPPAGTEISLPLDTSGLTEDNYFFVKMTADFAPGPAPEAFSTSMEFELRDAAGRVLLPYDKTGIGVIDSATPATPIWIGLSGDLYSGGPLTAYFRDRYTEAGGTFNAIISNVRLTFHPIPSTEISFPAIPGPIGPIIGAGPSFTLPLDQTPLQTADYFYYRIRADFIGVPGGSGAYSSTIQSSITDGTTVFKEFSQATLGKREDESNTALVWTGIFDEPFQFSAPLLGTGLFVEFKDTYTDNDGPFSSSLENIQVEFFTEVGTILPVELSNFRATNSDKGVELTWTTESELNNAGFEVQTSSNGDWSALSFVEGAGTTTEQQSYSFLVEDLEPGRHSFRLKQIDFDGRFELSQVVEITVAIPEGYALGQAYPNPFNPQATFTLALAEAQNVYIEIVDALGRRVQSLYQGELEAEKIHRFTINGSGLTSGLYFYRVSGRDFFESRMVQLVK